MGRRPARGETPEWEALYAVAADQAGYFSASQARELGFTTARLQYHVNTGKLVRPARGVFRLRHFPSSELEEYVVLWLWSDQQGIFSHETALMLHELSDALPARVHMTLPAGWARRRLRIPPPLSVHFADVPEADRTWKESIPLTSPRRALQDCMRDGTSPELLEQALRQARTRGLVSAEAVQEPGAAK
jgi:predicted transcriptional regulator of viral defense system